MAAKVPIRAVFSGTTATGLAEYQTDEFIALAYGGLGASLSLGSAGQVLKVNSAGNAVEFGAGATALDDIATGDAASTLATSAGNITIDAQGNNTDIIFKGTDASSDITMLTLDGSEAGAATFNNKVVATELDISGDVDVDGTLEADAYTVDGTTLAEFIADTAGAMVSSNTETGVTVTYQDGDNTIDFAIDAAQTTITSIYATDLIMGEDSQTAIDFGTANEIDFKVDNAARLTLTSGALYPVTDNQIDLGTSSLEFKDAYFDGTVTSDAFAGPLTGDVTGTSSKVTVTDSTANTNFPVVFHDESNALLDDTGALRYNPSTGELLVPKLTVAGTTTQVDTVTMQAANAVIFEGATADAHETTLSIVDPTGDHTQYLINQGGYIPLLAAATTTAITSTPAELNLLDGSSANSVVNSKAVIYGSSGELAGTLSTVAQGNVTSLGTLTTLTVDNIIINGTNIGHTSDSDAIAIASDGVVTFSQVPVLPNNTIETADIQDNAVTLAKMAGLARGKLIIGDSSGDPAALAAGSANYVLTSDGTDISWAEAASSADPSSADGDSLGTASAEWSDLYLADGGIIYFGNDQEITLTHVADTGLNLKHAASGDDKYPTFTLQTGDDDIAVNDVLGAINFQAPDEGAGTDAVLVAASIEAVSEGNFAADNNATKLSFKVASSETAAEKMKLPSNARLATEGGFLAPFDGDFAGTKGFVLNPTSMRLDLITSGTVVNECVRINKTGSDGDIITFFQAGTEEGYIAVSGSTVSYNTFTGAHEGQWETDISDPPEGTLISTVDGIINRIVETFKDEEGMTDVRTVKSTDPQPEGATRRIASKPQLTKIKITDKQADSRVYGVFGAKRKQGEGISVYAIGSAMVRVKGAISGGDLIQSSATAGVAEKQSDDVIRASTIGKVSRGDDETGERLVACVLYSG